MIPKVWLINIVLLAAVLYMGAEGYAIWAGGYDLPEPASVRKVKQPAYRGSIAPNRLQRRTAYERVASEDIFSPERKEFIPQDVEEVPVEEVPETVPLKDLDEKLYLQGIVIMDGYKKALVTNPYKKVKSDPSTLTVQENDAVESIKILSILKDRIIVLKDKERYEVQLFDENKPHRRTIDKSGRSAPRVVNAGRRGSGGNGEASKSSAQPSVTVVNTNKNAVDKPDEKASEPEVEYINTPFGRIKRVKKNNRN